MPLDDSSEKAIGPQDRAGTKEVRTKRIKELLEQGLSTKQIACAIGISTRAIRQYVKTLTDPKPSESILQLSTAEAMKAIARLVCGRSPTR